MVEQVKRIAEALLEGAAPEPQVTVREFLNWYGAKRRVENVVARIREDLAQYNIVTKPDFESAWIDSRIAFEVLPTEQAGTAVEGVELEIVGAKDQLTASESSIDKIEESQWVANDPTHQLSKLKAANQVVQFVFPNDSISVAITKMLLHDYSQLPVMTNERTVKGVISWKSIGAHLDTSNYR